MSSDEKEKSGHDDLTPVMTLHSKGSSDVLETQQESNVDVSAHLVAGDDGAPITPEESKRIRRKLDLHLLPILFLLYVCELFSNTLMRGIV